MEIFGLMSLGLFLGMTHAMDADHIAAVSAMWNRQGGKHGLMWRGLYWALVMVLRFWRFARFCCQLGRL
jgi:high-affinity nickel permease